MKTLLLLFFIASSPAFAMGRLPSDPATYSDISDLQSQISSTQAKQSAVNDAQAETNTQTNDRLDNLEKTKLFVENDVRLYDGKYTQFGLFNMFDVNQSKEFGAGVRITIKIGKSYEEKQIEELRRLLFKLKSEAVQ